MLQVGALDNQWDNRERWRDLAVLQKGHYFNRLLGMSSDLEGPSGGFMWCVVIGLPLNRRSPFRFLRDPAVSAT